MGSPHTGDIKPYKSFRCKDYIPSERLIVDVVGYMSSLSSGTKGIPGSWLRLFSSFFFFFFAALMWAGSVDNNNKSLTEVANEAKHVWTCTWVQTRVLIACTLTFSTSDQTGITSFYVVFFFIRDLYLFLCVFKIAIPHKYLLHCPHWCCIWSFLLRNRTINGQVTAF